MLKVIDFVFNVSVFWVIDKLFLIMFIWEDIVFLKFFNVVILVL